MDGDVAILTEIIEIARENGAWVVVDESHAIGVIGNQGRGTHEFLNIKDKAEIITCSLGKALGAIGGFIAGSEDLINLLELTCRPFIYSTSLPPSIASSLIKAFELLENNDPALNKLWSNINYFRNKIQLIQKVNGQIETAIFPLKIKDEIKLLELCTKLHENNIFVNPIFYPVVPKKKSRIRLSLTASLSHNELDYAIEKMAYYYKKMAIE
jgi:7-keto-8-aminopelargonate synthetase-like enzyme